MNKYNVSDKDGYLTHIARLHRNYPEILGVGIPVLERNGYDLKGLEYLYLHPRPYSGLGLLKCSELIRER